MSAVCPDPVAPQAGAGGLRLDPSEEGQMVVLGEQQQQHTLHPLGRHLGGNIRSASCRPLGITLSLCIKDTLSRCTYQGSPYHGVSKTPSHGVHIKDHLITVYQGYLITVYILRTSYHGVHINDYLITVYINDHLITVYISMIILSLCTYQ